MGGSTRESGSAPSARGTVEYRTVGDYRTVITPGSDRQASVITLSHHSASHHSAEERETGWQHDEDVALMHPDDRSESAKSATSASTWPAEASATEAQLAVAFNLSWVVNVLLFIAKLYAYYISHSKAVLASLADSFVDLVSQAVIAIADIRAKHADPRFPVGKARLEAVGVILCACLMTLSSFEVVRSSATDIYDGLVKGFVPELHLGPAMYTILGVATLLKLALYFYCAALQRRSDSMAALAEDHLNDVMSNAGAIATAAVASLWSHGWWVDPVGAIAISLYIVWRWVVICKGQVDKLVGMGAPADFVRELESLANTHHEKAFLDVMRAYHFGARYVVEMEIVMPAAMTVAESHDIALELQHKVEAIEDVERCFVHVDFQTRDEPEHKVERGLSAKLQQQSYQLAPAPAPQELANNV